MSCVDSTRLGTDAPRAADPESLLLTIARFARANRARGRAQTLPWKQFREELRRHRIRGEKDGAGFSPCAYREAPPQRKSANIVSIGALVLDVEDGSTPADFAALAPLEYVVYTTFNHTPAAPRFRIVLPLSQPIAAADWPRWWAAAVDQLAAGRPDASCKDLARFYYLPCRKPARLSPPEEGAQHHPGRLLDPDEITLPPLGARPLAGAGRRDGGRYGKGDYATLDAVRWFLDHGHYGGALGDGKHAVRCLWREEHTGASEAVDSDTVIWEADGRWPGYVCLHAHCDGRGIDAVMEKWGDADAYCSREFVPNRNGAHGPNGRRPLGPESEAAPSPDPDATARCSDLGNARRLVRSHGQDLRFTQAHGWLYWDGRRWQPDRAGEAMRRAKAAVAALPGEAAAEPNGERQKKLESWALQSEMAKRIREMLFLAQSEAPIAVLPEAFDRHPMLLTVANGTLDLETRSLREHQRGDLLTRLAPVEYDRAAHCPEWEAFLWSIFDGDEELIDFIQKAAGYSLTGDAREQLLLFLYGGGANGKSTLLKVLLALLGDFAAMAAPGLLLERRGEHHPTERADLAGKRLVASVEVGEGKRLAEELIKQLTGGEREKARFMRRDFFEFEREYKLWLAANHRPVIRGTDFAIWRRIPVIPFTVTFVDPPLAGPPPAGARLKDLNLLPKLLAELPGILAWAVRGCGLWQREGLRLPKAAQAATEEYRQEMDRIGAFIEECCVEQPGVWVLASDLRRGYVGWCERMKEEALSAGDFAQSLRERGHQPDRHGHASARIWKGIGLREPAREEG